MISINCTHCQQRLEMDEAFAGGVCRCQYCGTIQTVPSHLKQPSPAATAPAKVPHSAAGSGTGLDELAEVVASSGLSRSGLSHKSRAAQRSAAAAPAHVAGASSHATIDYAATDHQKRSPLIPLFIGVGVLAAAAIGFVAFFTLSPNSPVPGGGGTPVVNGTGGPVMTSPEEGPTLTIPGPAFADMSLESSKSIVYLIDRSQANSDVLDTLKTAVYYSALSLGPSRRFQIVFWSHNVEGIVAYPEHGLAPATAAEVDAAGAAFENVIAYDNTDLAATLVKALEVNPDAIVIATAKGLYLEDDDLEVFEKALQGTLTKVYAFSLGEAESPVLKQVAEKTGGGYRELTQTQLTRLKYHRPGM